MTMNAFARRARRLEALAGQARAKESALSTTLDACRTQVQWLATNLLALRRWGVSIENRVPADLSVDVRRRAARFSRWTRWTYLVHWRLWRSRLSCASCLVAIAALWLWERVSDILRDDALFFLTLIVLLLMLLIVVMLLV